MYAHTYFVTTEEFDLTLERNSEDSSRSNLENHFAVSIKESDDKIYELYRNNFKKTDKDRNKRAVSTVVTDFIQGNDDSADLLMVRFKAKLSVHNSKNIDSHGVVDANLNRQNFVKKTVNSFDQ
ncbi:unnamed protein product [Ceratitis capitata]|uniref:(Mediterranean fruit fly) hypothetical protein n=1 Tax=Ceratitis capitata TaxID=7213 RepID=A0A811UPR3_CERCA|nr:unnamed protein product [Ceratitis capitata]